MDRLKYILAQGSKDGLVSSPRNWPGINSAKAQMTGQSIRGPWYNRTGHYHARRKKGGHKARKIDFMEKLTLKLVPLPCWAHLPPEEYQARIRDLVEEIEQETAAMHALAGTSPLGRHAILKQDPLHCPKHLKTTPAPRVHAYTKAARPSSRAIQGLKPG